MGDKRLVVEWLEGDGINIRVGEKPKWAMANLSQPEVCRLINALERVSNITIPVDGDIVEEPAP